MMQSDVPIVNERTTGVMHRAIYPGTFDPLTNGHLDIISRACSLFDEVVVAVLVNPGKQPLFSVMERVELTEAVLKPLYPQIRVGPFSGLLVDFAREQRSTAIIRGLRSSRDYEYELPMALMNRQLAPDIETIFLIGSVETAGISSSLIKEVFSLGGSINGMVPELVISKMKERR